MDDKYLNLSWNLSKSFIGAVSTCLFEQGDTLYRTKELRESWTKSIQSEDFIIQVNTPKRNGSPVSPLMFKKNWESEISFTKHYPNKSTQPIKITTTQGRLLEFLINNDESIFKDKECIIPITFKDVKKKDIIVEELEKDCEESLIRFCLLMDESIDLHLKKYYDIRDALTSRIDFSTKSIPAKDCLSKPEDMLTSQFMPTIFVVIFDIKSEKIKIETLLKPVLFSGKKNEFKLESHGVVIDTWKN